MDRPLTWENARRGAPVFLRALLYGEETGVEKSIVDGWMNVREKRARLLSARVRPKTQMKASRSRNAWRNGCGCSKMSTSWRM